MKFKKDILHKKVKIKATGEIAYIVWYDEHPEHDSFLLDLAERDELPLFYEFDDFIFLEEQTMQIRALITIAQPFNRFVIINKKE